MQQEWRARARGGGRGRLGCEIEVGGDVEAKKLFKLLSPSGCHGGSLPAHLAAWPSQGLQDQLSAVLSLLTPGNTVAYPSAGRKDVVLISTRPP